MAQRGRPKKRIEFVNYAEGIIIWVEVFDESTGVKKIVGKKVEPGKSVFLTEEEEQMNRINSPNYFLNGMLRQVDAKARALAQIVVADDISELEAIKWTESITEVDKFKEGMAKIKSINTLNLFEKIVREQNKTIDFFMVIQKRKEAVEIEKSQSLTS